MLIPRIICVLPRSTCMKESLISDNVGFHADNGVCGDKGWRRAKDGPCRLSKALEAVMPVANVINGPLIA